jgi:hypothetical protein
MLRLLKSKFSMLLHDDNHNDLRICFVHVYARGCCVLNFVEAMALYRAFKVGRFRCVGTKPVIMVGDFPSQGYTLVIRKESAKKFCLSCAKTYYTDKGLNVREDEKYLTFYST